MWPILLLLAALPSAVLGGPETPAARWTVEESIPWLREIANRPFGELVEAYDLKVDLRDKGCTGILLEQLLGMSRDNRPSDFLDAELKTNRSAPDGTPLETMYITQIGSRIDDLLEAKPFDQTWLAAKIRRVVYLPVVKEGDPGSWYFLPYRDIETGPGSRFHAQVKTDYETICADAKQAVEETGELRTASGKYLQIRTKDRKPYTPIRSARYGRFLSDKNYAFYFRREFMMDAARPVEGE